jgi:glycine/D-amino acid oxidase-like deaminating enzyme
MSGAPSSARVLIIGGGIGGVSVAYHLALLGAANVVLLERAALSSGTTWHSTGNMETYRADPLIFEMVRYAARTYPRVAAETRRDIGWRVVGRVMYTDREERWESLQTLPELGRARGIDIEVLAQGSPAACRSSPRRGFSAVSGCRATRASTRPMRWARSRTRRAHAAW